MSRIRNERGRLAAVLLDRVPFHPHAPEDVQGLPNLFPPIVQAVGVVPSPVRNGALYVTLPDMVVTVTPPAGICPVWEAALWFDGSFEAIDAILSLRLVRDPAGVPVVLANTERSHAIVFGPNTSTMELAGTFLVSEGVPTSFGVQWSRLGTDVTAVLTSRRLRATLRPYQPAAV